MAVTERKITLAAALLAACIAVTRPCGAQERIPSVRNGENMVFESVEACFGTVTDDSGPQKAELRFESHGGTRIARIVTSCGCLSASAGKMSYDSGERGAVTLLFDPHRMAGEIDVKAFVYVYDELSSEARLEAVLRMYGEVNASDEWDYLPVRAGDLRMKRSVAEIPDGESVTRILCANTGEKPLMPEIELLPEWIEACFEPREIAPGAEADLVIRICGERRACGFVVKAGLNTALIYVK